MAGVGSNGAVAMEVDSETLEYAQQVRKINSLNEWHMWEDVSCAVERSFLQGQRSVEYGKFTWETKFARLDMIGEDDGH